MISAMNEFQWKIAIDSNNAMKSYGRMGSGQPIILGENVPPKTCLCFPILWPRATRKMMPKASVVIEIRPPVVEIPPVVIGTAFSGIGFRQPCARFRWRPALSALFGWQVPNPMSKLEIKLKNMLGSICYPLPSTTGLRPVHSYGILNFLCMGGNSP